MKRYNYPLNENDIKSLMCDFNIDSNMNIKIKEYLVKLELNDGDLADFESVLSNANKGKISLALKSYWYLDTYMRDIIVEFLNEYIQDEIKTVKYYDNWFLINHMYKTNYDGKEYKIIGNWCNDLVLANIHNFDEVLIYSENEMNELINDEKLKVL